RRVGSVAGARSALAGPRGGPGFLPRLSGVGGGARPVVRGLRRDGGPGGGAGGGVSLLRRWGRLGSQGGRGRSRRALVRAAGGQVLLRRRDHETLKFAGLGPLVTDSVSP